MSEPAAPTALPTVQVNATRFRAAHAGEWAQLEAIVTRVEKRGIGALDDDQLLALPLLYRSTLSALAVARETSLDRSLLTYLEALSIRAYYQIYGVPMSFGRQFGAFLRHGWPEAVRGLWRETLGALLLTVLGAVAGFVMVLRDPATFYAFMPDAMSQGRDPSASAAALRATLYGHHDDKGLATFATFLFNHNAQIAIFAFALGFAFALPSALLITYNGLMLGAFLAVFASKGLLFQAGGWLFIHGTTEIFAIILSGAAGFRIGAAIAFPGRARRLDHAFATGRSAAVTMGGTVIMLAVAGLLEGIGRQTVQSDLYRYAIGGAMFTGWCTYFYATRGRNAL